MDVDAFRQLCQQSPPSGSHVLPWSPALVHDSSVAASIRNRTRDERVRGSSENRMGLPGKGNRSRRLLPGLSCPVLSSPVLSQRLSPRLLSPPSHLLLQEEWARRPGRRHDYRNRTRSERDDDHLIHSAVIPGTLPVLSEHRQSRTSVGYPTPSQHMIVQSETCKEKNR